MESSTQMAYVPMVRIDRNIIHNIDSLFDAFGIGGADLDDNLHRAVIYYLCLNYQQNLFAWSMFDPYDFAEQMGYSKTFLRGRHPKPQFIEDYKTGARKAGKTETEVEEEWQKYLATGAPTYESNLENALWSLWQKEVVFCHGAKFYNSTDREEEIKQHTITRMPIIRSLNITEKRVGRTNQRKFLYSVEMDERFIHSLTKYFIRANKDTLIALRKSKLDILYLKMLQYKENAIFSKTPEVTLEKFELLAKWAGIATHKSNGEPVPNKTRKQQLKAALTTLQEKTDLDFTHDCKTVRRQKFPYTFIVRFNLDHAKYELREHEDKIDLKQIFQETLQRDLLEFWKYKDNKKTNPLEFDIAAFNWWLNSYEDDNEKISIYILALTKIYGKYTNNSKKSYESQAYDWLKRLGQQKLLNL